MEFRPPLDPALLVRARSEPTGVEVDWYQRVGPDTLDEVCSIVTRYLDHQIPPTGELRYLELIVGDTGRQLVMREPSAHEREQGVGIRPPEPAAGDALPTPLTVQYFDVGPACLDERLAKGPSVAWPDLLKAVRSEIDHRT